MEMNNTEGQVEEVLSASSPAKEGLIKFLESNIRGIFIASAFFMLLYMLFSSGNYGICWDEALQNEYGHNVVKFYTSGFKDTSYINNEKLTHLYGGLVEMVCVVAEKILPLDTYDARHLVVAIFGFLAILFTGFTAKIIQGWRAGLIAMWFVFLTPVFFGHAMFNSKDIPFATAYIMAICFMVRFFKEFPKPSWKTILLLVLSIGMAINIRVGGLLLVAYLFAFGLYYIISVFSEQTIEEMDASLFRKLAMYVLLFSVGGYCCGLLFWPFGLTGPFTHPYEALKMMSSYDVFDSYNLFEGHWIHRNEIPWYYIPQWILITTPLYITALFALIPFFALLSGNLIEKESKRLLAMILFAAVFPVAYIIFKNSNVYDGWRHALFVFPPLVVATAVFWERFLVFLSRINMRIFYVAFALLFCFMAEPFVFMLKNRSLESFYFSPLIGGTTGAFKKYELDYYGTSLRQAVEWIAANADSSKTKPIRVRSTYGELMSVQHFIDKYKDLQLVFQPDLSPDWDYSIVLTTAAKHDSLLLKNWPPPGTVHEIKSGGAPIAAIVSNIIQNNPAAALANLRQQITASNDPVFLINGSLALFNAQDYFGSIDACERALQIDSSNVTALNNITAALNNLSLFGEAIPYGEKALRLNPSFTLAAANLEISKKNQNKELDPKFEANQLINLSVVYHNTRQFNRCIDLCKKSLLRMPDNAIAYNNMCSSYNGLGNFLEAEKAGAKAVALNPNIALFKNNLDFARSKLAK